MRKQFSLISSFNFILLEINGNKVKHSKLMSFYFTVILITKSLFSIFQKEPSLLLKVPNWNQQTQTRGINKQV